MFSLIIVIISIALVAALALATLYYGGTAFESGGDEARIAAIQNEGAQIRGALETYKVAEGGLPTGTETEIKDKLIEKGYLKAFPTGTVEWTLVDDFAVVKGLSDTECLAVNAKFGLSTIPTCDDPAIEGRSACCSDATAP